MSLDGRTALPNGVSQWISGPPARAWVHRLRADCDAVIVGGGTVRADDPLLTSRGQRRPEPLRVVLSRSLICRTRPASGISTPRPPLSPMGRKPRSAPCGWSRAVVAEVCEPQTLMEALARRGCNRCSGMRPGAGGGGPAPGVHSGGGGCDRAQADGGVAARTPLGDLDLERMEDLPAGVLQPPVGIGEDWLMRFRLRACIDSDR